MTVPRWNAQEFDQNMRGQPSKRRMDAKHLKTVLAIAVAGIFLGGAATAGSQVFDQPDPIGICHATGSAENPYVFLVADEHSYEHGHHRHHEGDFFREASAGHCDDDVWTDPVNATTSDDNNTDEGPDDGLDDGPADNSTEAAPENSTEAPADNSTDDAPADDGQETAANETSPAPGDIRVVQGAVQDDHQVTLTLTIENVGEDEATNVSLSDALPDVRRPWALSGADAADCTLGGDDLSCWFGTLAPSESVAITLQAYLDRMPCGKSMTNTAYGAADGDPEPRNDASSASITARYC